jgi:hypothetical protein
MTTAQDIERVAMDCGLNPLTCGFRGSYCEGMTPLCLKEWVKGDFYHPFCPNRIKYTVRVEKVEPVNIEVMAYGEQDAFDKALDYYVLDIEPEMKIVGME